MTSAELQSPGQSFDLLIDVPTPIDCSNLPQALYIDAARFADQKSSEMYHDALTTWFREREAIIRDIAQYKDALRRFRPVREVLPMLRDLISRSKRTVNNFKLVYTLLVSHCGSKPDFLMEPQFRWKTRTPANSLLTEIQEAGDVNQQTMLHNSSCLMLELIALRYTSIALIQNSSVMSVVAYKTSDMPAKLALVAALTVISIAKELNKSLLSDEHIYSVLETPGSGRTSFLLSRDFHTAFVGNVISAQLFATQVLYVCTMSFANDCDRDEANAEYWSQYRRHFKSDRSRNLYKAGMACRSAFFWRQVQTSGFADKSKTGAMALHREAGSFALIAEQLLVEHDILDTSCLPDSSTGENSSGTTTTTRPILVYDNQPNAVVGTNTNTQHYDEYKQMAVEAYYMTMAAAQREPLCEPIQRLLKKAKDCLTVLYDGVPVSLPKDDVFDNAQKWRESPANVPQCLQTVQLFIDIDECQSGQMWIECFHQPSITSIIDLNQSRTYILHMS